MRAGYDVDFREVARLQVTVVTYPNRVKIEYSDAKGGIQIFTGTTFDDASGHFLAWLHGHDNVTKLRRGRTLKERISVLHLPSTPIPVSDKHVYSLPTKRDLMVSINLCANGKRSSLYVGYFARTVDGMRKARKASKDACRAINDEIIRCVQ